METETKKIFVNLKSKTREYTSFLRVMPDFMIIGAKRCGTSSLYNYLIQHPSIIPAKKKEIHFFGKSKKAEYYKGIKSYRQYFPTIIQKKYIKLVTGAALTGEASPHYISNPLIVERIYKTLPDIKLIYILRNPVDRAYSHYRLDSRKGREKLSFEEAVALESEKKLDGKIDVFSKNLKSYNSGHRCKPYITRGLYEQQLKKWYELFPKEKLFFIHSEEFFEDPGLQLNRAFKFLGLPEHRLKEYKKFEESKNKPDNMGEELRKKLGKYYEPFNRKLYDLLGRDLKWE